MKSSSKSTAVTFEEPTLMLPALSEQERDHLRTVLQRAEDLQRNDEWRKVKLRTSTNMTVIPSMSSSPSTSKTCSKCSSCGAKLVCLINPSKRCDFCEKSSCKKCIKVLYGGKDHLCIFCFVDLKYRLESGAWFYSKRKKADRIQKFAIEELRDALERMKSSAKATGTKDGSEVGRSPHTSPMARRELDRDALDHNFAFTSSLPSIMINEGSPTSTSSDHPVGGIRGRILRRKAKQKGSDGARSVSTEFSDSSSHLGSITSQGSMSVSQESLVSLYSLADENFSLPAEMATGDVQLSLEYDRKKSQLLVTVRQCKNLLPYAKSKRSSDPFVKIYLLPDKTRTAKRKTSHKKNTVHPVFNETFKYHLESDNVETRSLWVTVWHHITMGHNVFLGEVIIHLSDVSLDDPAPQWYNLHEKREIDVPSPHLIYKGDLYVAVKHVPSSGIIITSERQVESKGELHVWIKEAKNLIPTHSNGFSNPFAKALLLPDKSRRGKRKTPVIRKTLCPSWNTIFHFDNVSAAELEERSLEITVWDRSRLRANEFLGGVRLNLGKGQLHGEPAKWMIAHGYEVTLWRAVMNRADTWVEGCLALRANMD